MKTSWKSLTIASVWMVGCLAIGARPAHAQAFSFGYSGPGVSVGVATGAYGYYGGGYYGGYPAGAPAYVTVAPVLPVVVRRPILLPGPLVGPGPVVVRRPYGLYRPFPYYRRW